jgi:protein-tyrosine phosphatase
MAAGAFRRLVGEQGLAHLIGIDSAGTGDYHIGDPPDARAQAEAAKRGVDISAWRARQVCARDFHDFDYVLAMDRSNHAALDRLRPRGALARLELILDYAPAIDLDEVPDPYFGGAHVFALVFDMIEAAVAGLLDEIRKTHDLPLP